MANPIKMRLMSLEKKQTDLYDELGRRGIKINTFQQLNAYINGRNKGERARFILANVNRIIEDWEKVARKP
jgi:hypothetical protein